MGNLHDGHLALLAAAKKNCDFVVATIFVNPLQFGPREDLDKYPRSLEEDINKLIISKCDVLFNPAVKEIYPQGLNTQTIVSVPALSTKHCGKNRPGHFDGVSTIVCKLLNVVNPHTAFFGLKDFQQYLIIKKMVEDLILPVNIIGVDIARETSGLALSSRNNYLSTAEKAIAVNLYNCLKSIKAEIEMGNLNFQTLELSAKNILSKAGMKVDYFTVCNAKTLERANKKNRELIILSAVNIGSTRLIDNIIISS